MTIRGHPPLSLVHRVREPAVAPAGQPPTVGPPPLLLLFHGVGSNELAMASIADRFDPSFLILSVRSPIEVGPFSYAWFHVTFTPQGPLIDGDEFRAACARAVGFIDEAVAAYGADPKRVFAAGFSQGGIVALATMLIAPEKVAGAVCMSGRLPPELVSEAAPPDRVRGKPALVVHGSRDDTLSVAYGRDAARSLTDLGLDVTYRELDIAHTTTAESLATVSAWLTDRLSS